MISGTYRGAIHRVSRVAEKGNIAPPPLAITFSTADTAWGFIERLHR